MSIISVVPGVNPQENMLAILTVEAAKQLKNRMQDSLKVIGNQDKEELVRVVASALSFPMILDITPYVSTNYSIITIKNYISRIKLIDDPADIKYLADFIKKEAEIYSLFKDYGRYKDSIILLLIMSVIRATRRKTIRGNIYVYKNSPRSGTISAKKIETINIEITYGEIMK